MQNLCKTYINDVFWSYILYMYNVWFLSTMWYYVCIICILHTQKEKKYKADHARLLLLSVENPSNNYSL